MVGGMLPTRALELTSIFLRETQSPMSAGIVPVRLAPEIVRVSRDLREEVFEGKGRASWSDWIFISVTNPSGEHVMHCHLQGLESCKFQFDSIAEGGEEEEEEE